VEVGGTFDVISDLNSSTTIQVSLPTDNISATLPPVRVG
jgi:hypothetical protein